MAELNVDKMAKNVAEKALDDYVYQGKTIREWIAIIAKNAWIPVSERVPEAGEYIGDVAKYYLVQNEYGDMLVARYTHSGYWEQIYQLKPCADEIVAWMPKPAPYREGANE